MNEFMNKKSVVIIVFVLVALLTYVLEKLSLYPLFHSNPEYWFSIGQFFSGTFGIIISFLTVFFMYLTFKDQRKQKAETFFQQYVTNYYTLVSLINENWLHANPATYMSGREIFGNAVRVFNLDILYKDMIDNNSTVAIPTKKELNTCQNGFSEVYKLHVNVFGHYCEYIKSAIIFFFKNRDLNDCEKEDYANRYISMLSFYELVFFSYYIVSQMNNDIEYKEQIKKCLCSKIEEYPRDCLKATHIEQVKNIKRLLQ